MAGVKNSQLLRPIALAAYMAVSAARTRSSPLWPSSGNRLIPILQDTSNTWVSSRRGSLPIFLNQCHRLVLLGLQPRHVAFPIINHILDGPGFVVAGHRRGMRGHYQYKQYQHAGCPPAFQIPVVLTLQFRCTCSDVFTTVPLKAGTMAPNGRTTPCVRLPPNNGALNL